MTIHVNIDYTEGDPTSYRGVVAVPAKGAKGTSMRWASGNPQADWAAYMAWAETQRGIVLMGSSVTHFLWDVPGWRMETNTEGREVLVPEDRPHQRNLRAKVGEEDALAYHPDPVVQAWHQRMNGDSDTRIAYDLGVHLAKVRALFAQPAPAIVQKDARHLTDKRGAWISQEGQDQFLDVNGDKAAFLVLMLPWRITNAALGKGLRAIRAAIRADGRPAFRYGPCLEGAPLSALLRIVHHKGYTAWEIAADGTVQAYDGRYASLAARKTTDTSSEQTAD
jgi:hypothetical protein